MKDTEVFGAHTESSLTARRSCPDPWRAVPVGEGRACRQVRWPLAWRQIRGYSFFTLN